MTSATFETLQADSPYAQALREGGSIAWAQRGEALCREGERSSHVFLIASGYVVAVKRTASGLQQNVALYVPNDIVDHESFTLGATRCSAVALTAVTFHKVPHGRLREILEGNLDHSKAFWRYVAFHGASGPGMAAQPRAALRLRAHRALSFARSSTAPARPAAPREVTCPMPLTQTELADTLGLSVVHVNRTLMRLRQEGLIRLRRGQIDVLDWSAFQGVPPVSSRPIWTVKG